MAAQMDWLKLESLLKVWLLHENRKRHVGRSIQLRSWKRASLSLSISVSLSHPSGLSIRYANGSWAGNPFSNIELSKSLKLNGQAWLIYLRSMCINFMSMAWMEVKTLVAPWTTHSRVSGIATGVHMATNTGSFREHRGSWNGKKWPSTNTTWNQIQRTNYIIIIIIWTKSQSSFPNNNNNGSAVTARTFCIPRTYRLLVAQSKQIQQIWATSI